MALRPIIGASTAPISVGEGYGTLFNQPVPAHAGAGAYLSLPRGSDEFRRHDLRPGPDLTTPPFFPCGDLNGDGVVSAAELETVRQNYWKSNPLQLTGLSASGHGTVQFGVSNGGSPAFTVLASTNLVNWQVLSNAAVPQYLFNDPDAAKYPRRFYASAGRETTPQGFHEVVPGSDSASASPDSGSEF